MDASQAAGAHPIDVGAVAAGLSLAVGYKWLLGPYSLGYLYVAPKWHERGVPIEQTWMSRAGAEDFTRLVDYIDEMRPGARRFDMGEFSQFTLLPMATAALEQVLEWGVDRASRATSVRSRRASRARSPRWAAPSPPSATACGTCSACSFPAACRAGLAERLAEAARVREHPRRLDPRRAAPLQRRAGRGSGSCRC